jgi:hypothetical protein
LISESGVGAIYEWQNNKTAVPWTCAYQAKALVDIVEESISDSNVSGLALWHFFDFKSTGELVQRAAPNVLRILRPNVHVLDFYRLCNNRELGK